jgi:hypothetical protein
LVNLRLSLSVFRDDEGNPRISAQSLRLQVTNWQGLEGYFGAAMTNYSANPSPHAEEPPRASSRASVSLLCEVRQGSRHWQKVRLEDLSPSGFRINGLTHVSTTVPVSIRIPGMQLLSAAIRWQSGVVIGCEFTKPLHVAVYDHLVRQSRDLSR